VKPLLIKQFRNMRYWLWPFTAEQAAQKYELRIVSYTAEQAAKPRPVRGFLLLSALRRLPLDAR